GFEWDAVQMPLNPFDAHFHSFGKLVLPELKRRGVAALGMKPMGGTADSIKRGVVKGEELLRYAMSLPVATTICGMDSFEALRSNLKIAQNFTAMTPKEMAALETRCKPHAGDGHFEVYKTSLRFDNPVTRSSHGFPIDATQKEVKEMFKNPSGTWTAE